MNIDLPIKWLKDTLLNLKYGTITLTFTIHDGRISKIGRGVTESLKPGNEDKK